MHILKNLDYIFALLPAFLMLFAAFNVLWQPKLPLLWRRFTHLAIAAFLCSALALLTRLIIYYTQGGAITSTSWLEPNLLGSWVSLLVQFLGWVIVAFSSRYLRGEPHQKRYIAALAGVLASVHFLLLANHWIALIVAWAAIGFCMHRLLIFYPERPYALLAAHKKRIADRLADIFLIIAAALAWHAVGSGSLADLWAYIDQGGRSPELGLSAILLTIAVILRTALLPVHGWLIQVMEAPTPVSALLHAGVVNLGGYILVFFAPLLGVAALSRWLLVLFGLASAVLGGTVMLTRISIKVDLAWSTLAQMGFMLLECGLGLYQLAALHLLGHSLYKAHSFLSTTSKVGLTRQLRLYGHTKNTFISMLLAPFIAWIVIYYGQQLLADMTWPWWWTGVLSLAWAPMLWVPKSNILRHFIFGFACVIGFTFAVFIVEYLPLGAGFEPFSAAGWLAFLGLLFMYCGFVLLQTRPRELIHIRHWIYAGFYLDEIYTILAIRLWPTSWARPDTRSQPMAFTKKTKRSKKSART